MDHRRVDNYELRDELGYGGMATVWRARDTRLDRDVAVKILHEHIASRPENRDRFEREAKAMARLRHRNIPDVYGFSSPNAPVQYIAVELVDGPTLRTLVEEDLDDNAGRVGAPEIGAALGLVVARALAHAHESGVIHRDIKPENVMLTSEGHPQLMDFGLARVMDATRLTQTGAILGSPAHMSPEVIEGSAIDHRADIFAFGTLLYYICTGRLPFDGRNPAYILNAILSGDYQAADRVDARVPPDLSALIDDCLRTDPADRPSSMTEVIGQLETVVSDAGLDDADEVLERWFVHRAEWVDGFRHRRLNELERDAADALRRGRVAPAMRFADRILAWSPGNEGALALLERARVRHRLRGLTRGGVAVIVLVTLAALLAIQLGGQPDTTTIPDDGRPTLESVTVAEPEFETDARANRPAFQEDDGAPTRSGADEQADRIAAALTTAAALGELVVADAATVARQVEQRPFVRLNSDAIRTPVLQVESIRATVRQPSDDGGGVSDNSERQPDAAAIDATADVTAETASPIPFQLRVAPRTALVRIDGRVPRGENGEYLEQADALMNTRVPLVPGSYTVRAWIPNQEAFGVEQTVTVSENTTSARVLVAYAPARLTVSSAVEGNVQLARDGGPFRSAGRTGQPIDLAMSHMVAEATIQVSVIPDGGGALLRSDEVLINSGQNLTLRVDR